jgi:hypothetical protein
MKKTIETIAIIHFFMQGLMPLLGAFVYAILVDSYNWVAAIIGFLGTMIYSAYLINHYSVSKNFFFAIITIFLPIILVLYEISVSGTPFSSFFLKTAFINLCALTLVTSIPLILMGFVNPAILPGALVLAGIGGGIVWLLYFTAGYLEPNDINQSFSLLIIAVVFEMLRTGFGLFGISNAINEKTNNFISKFFANSDNKIFQMQKPEALAKNHDQIMTVIGATSFVAFFILIIL